MNNNKIIFKEKAISETTQIVEAIKTFIQPFTELPQANIMGNGNVDRINAHELFSLYTADIIKEDTVFAR